MKWLQGMDLPDCAERELLAAEDYRLLTALVQKFGVRGEDGVICLCITYAELCDFDLPDEMVTYVGEDGSWNLALKLVDPVRYREQMAALRDQLEVAESSQTEDAKL